MPINLNVSTMLERAEQFYPKKSVISRTLHQVHRLTYKEMGERTRRLASVLRKLGVKQGDRVGTVASNHHRHLEAYFAIPGLGAIMHTVNIRFSPEHIIHIINHAEDKILMIDEELLPLFEKLRGQLPKVKAYIVMSDDTKAPESCLEPLYSYEALLAEGEPNFPFVKNIDENSPAGLCYTFATAGNLKGIAYTHRALVLHSLAVGLVDTLALSESDVCMPVVPMFHINAWGIPYASTWFGATQVLPGPHFTPETLADLIALEKVTVTASVPTVLLGLYMVMNKGKHEIGSLRRVVCGGSAAPVSLIAAYEEKLGIPFYHAYGMTETTPLVTVARLKSYQTNLGQEQRVQLQAKQGMLVPGLEMRVEGASGNVRWDGQERGELLLRGPWIADGYYKDETDNHVFQDGWLHTGDIVTVDQEGFIKLAERTKDLIKSGGEWISPIDLEVAILGHEGVYEVAVVAVPSAEWGERPVACVVLRDEYKGKVTKEDILAFIAPNFAKWWLPDDLVFMDEIPKTPIGKFQKKKLREELRHQLAKPV